MLLNFDTSQPNSNEYYNLDTPWVQMNMDQGTINNRVMRAAFAMSPLMTMDEIQKHYENFDESGFRERASVLANQDRGKYIADLARQRLFTDLDQAANPYRPSSVVESKYGEKVIGALQEAPGEDVEDDDSYLSRLRSANPALYMAATKISRDNIAYHEKLYNKFQEAQKSEEANYDRQEYVGLKIPSWQDIVGASEWFGTANLTERGAVPGTFWQGGAMGANKEAQRLALMRMPFEQRMEMIDQVFNPLIQHSPSQAKDLLKYLMDPSVLEQQRNDLFNSLDVGIVAPFGKAAISRVIAWNDLRRITNTVEQRMAEARTSNITNVVTDAAGKPELTGVRRAATDLATAGGQHPQDATTESLNTIFTPFAEKIRTGGPMANGNAVYNRVMEKVDANRNYFINLSATVARNLRIAPALADETAMKLTYEQIMNQRPWLYDEVGNMGPLEWNNHTGTLSTDQRLMQPDGRLWTSVEQAQNYMRAKGVQGELKEVKDLPRALTFKTEQGSEYVVNPNGSTTRNASKMRPKGSRSAKGAQPTSEATFYGTKEAQQALAHPEGKNWRLIDHGDGTFSMSTLNAKGQWGISPDARNIPLSKTPAEGMYPIEVWGGGETYGKTSYSNIHYGNKITEIPDILQTGIYPQGKGYYISYRIPMPETGVALRDAVIKTAEADRMNKGFLNKIGAGKLRGSDEVLNEKLQTDRKMALYTPAVMEAAIRRMKEPAELAAAPFRGQNWREVWDNLGKNKAFRRLLMENQKAQREFKDIPELYDYYLRNEGRAPDDVEIEGYFAQRQGHRMDLAFRNLAATKDMQRHGAEWITLSKRLDSGEIVKSPEVVGIPHGSFPDGYGLSNVLIQRGNTFTKKRIDNLLKTEEGQLLHEDVKEGRMKLHQLYHDTQKPLHEYGELKPKDYVQFVLTDETTSRPLDFYKFPEKEGGHLEYEFEHSVKQPEIIKDGEVHHYLGDKTSMLANERALTEDMSKHLNEIQRLLFRVGGKEGIQLAKEVARKTFIDWRTIRSNFKSGKWDTEQPFYAVPKNKTIADIPNHFDQYTRNGNKFRDAAMGGGSLERQFPIAFTGQRDAYDVWRIDSLGTYDNPILAYRPAEYVDPYVSANRALSRIIHSSYMDDVKIASATDWLSRYQNNMEDPDVWKNPWMSFQHGKIKDGLPGDVKNRMESERQHIFAFHGIPSTTDTWVNRLEQEMADRVYLSESKGGKRANLVAQWTLDKAIKTPAFLRSFAYRAGIGFFSPVQLFVQMNTYASIFGISGFKAAGKGTLAATLHTLSHMPNVNEEILQGLDRVASKAGWLPGDFLEARQAMLDTGFHRVGSNTNLLRQSMYPHKLFNTTWGNVLNAGDMFFNMGETASRYGAWYTAHQEWRAANPTGRMTMQDRQWILNRADMLSGNMTKASKSRLQEGWGSFPTQFLGYWMRTVEQFTGHRLTTAQRARMFTVYGLLYGLPVATDLLPIPFSEPINRYALDKGWIPEGGTVSKAFFQGIIGTAIGLISGNEYNFGSRYGPGPGGHFNFLSQDESFWKVFLGPVGDMLLQTWGNIEPFIKAGGSWVQGKPIPSLSSDDFIQPLKVVSSIANVNRLSLAIGTQNSPQGGYWYSRSGTRLADNVTPLNAYLMSMTGLSPLSVDRTGIYRDGAKTQEANEKDAERLVVQEVGRYMRDVKEKNFSQATEHWKNAYAYMEIFNYPYPQRAKLWNQAFNAASQNLPDRETYQYYMGTHVPSNEIEKRSQKFNQIQTNKAP